MTERTRDSVRGCSGHTDFCKEHLAERMRDETALQAYMNTMCDKCADEFTEFCESVLKKANKKVLDDYIAMVKQDE
jgi:hypothetical protein